MSGPQGVAEVETQPAQPETLRRGLNAVHVQLISLGGIIGSCYFLGIGYNVAQVGPATALALMLGGLIVWLVANGMGELCVALPRAGSFVSFAREMVGRPWAAGVGWSYWFNWCAYVPSEMIAGGIIMNHFLPQLPVMFWAMVFGGVITFVNLGHVKAFGNIESALALIKIAAIIMFCVIGVLIWSGSIGPQRQFLGTRYLTGGHGLAGLFPAGVPAALLTMVMILVNYQGTEIVAISAAETKNPEKNIPTAIRNVAYRIVAIFVVPVIILVSILPHKEAGLEDSVFAHALTRYGMSWVGGVFSFVVLTAALSCANSGLYGTIRSIYSLSREGLAPAWLSKLNRHGVPARATLLTIGVCWAFVPLFLVFQKSAFYTWLLSVSGFTGAVCWISISWCQLRFRKRILARGYTSRDLVFAAPAFPYLSYFAIWVQIGCLVAVALNRQLRSCLVMGIPAVLIPLFATAVLTRLGKLPEKPLPPDEKSFDELFPPRR
jgi:amino acid transporter, AAT family